MALGMVFPAVIAVVSWAAFGWWLAMGGHWALQLVLLTIGVVALWMIGVMV
jgi:hypothetical protein